MLDSLEQWKVTEAATRGAAVAAAAVGAVTTTISNKEAAAGEDTRVPAVDPTTSLPPGRSSGLTALRRSRISLRRGDTDRRSSLLLSQLLRGHPRGQEGRGALLLPLNPFVPLLLLLLQLLLRRQRQLVCVFSVNKKIYSSIDIFIDKSILNWYDFEFHS